MLDLSKLDPKDRRRLEKLAKLVKNGDVAILDHLLEVENRIEDLKQNVPDVQAVLDSIKGQDGKTPIKGQDYFTTDELATVADAIYDRVPKPQDGVTPIAGQDYPTKQEIVSYIDSLISKIPKPKDGLTPVAGIDFPLPIRGETGLTGLSGIDGKDGSPDTPLQVAEKLNTLSQAIKQDVIIGLPDLVRNFQHSLGFSPTTILFYQSGVLVGRASNINVIGTVTVSGDLATITAGGAGTPGGLTTQVQFNDAGSFGGDAGFTYSKTTDTVTVVHLKTDSIVSTTNDIVQAPEGIFVDDDRSLDFGGTYMISTKSSIYTSADVFHIAGGSNIGTGNGMDILIETANGTVNGNIRFANNNTEVMRITNLLLGIGTATPVNQLDIPTNNTDNSIMRLGNLEFSSYGVNNCWFGTNVYYSSGFIHRDDGYMGLFYFANDEGQFRFFDTQVATTNDGDGVSQLKINRSGQFGVGAGIVNSVGDFTGSDFLVDVGKVTVYNTINTVTNGVPSLFAQSNLTTQQAVINATTIYAVPAGHAGVYRVVWVATITRVASTSSVLGGTNGFQVKYTDNDDSVVKTSIVGNSITSAANTTATSISGSLIANCKASTNLQFLFDYTSIGATPMQYNLHIRVEAI